MTVQPADDTKRQDVASTFEARLEDVRAAPADEGIVELIVRRPAENERELLDEARIDEDLGLIGDQLGDPRRRPDAGVPVGPADPHQHPRPGRHRA